MKILVFYGIFINKFCKKIGGRVHFEPLPPPPLVCIYVQTGHNHGNSDVGPGQLKIVVIERLTDDNW